MALMPAILKKREEGFTADDLVAWFGSKGVVVTREALYSYISAYQKQHKQSVASPCPAPAAPPGSIPVASPRPVMAAPPNPFRGQSEAAASSTGNGFVPSYKDL